MRTQGGGGCLQTRKRTLIRTQPCRPLISDFQLPELWEKCLLFKLPSLWCSLWQWEQTSVPSSSHHHLTLWDYSNLSVLLSFPSSPLSFHLVTESVVHLWFILFFISPVICPTQSHTLIRCVFKVGWNDLVAWFQYISRNLIVYEHNFSPKTVSNQLGLSNVR